MQYIATCAFGLEKPVHDELKKLGLWVVSTEDGRITFEGTEIDMIRANLWLRCADRIQIKMGEFDATTFDELFDAVNDIEWEKYIGAEDSFPVEAVSVKSMLHSEPAIQSIVKKSIVKRLQLKHKTDYLPESSGSEFRIYVKANKDHFVLGIDSSGDSLHKRGYRTKANLSPIKETLASAMVTFSDFDATRTLIDPFCGSGTILIEAYLKLKNIAPGLNRDFAFHNWQWVDKDAIQKAYEEARGASSESVQPQMYGFDIDPYALQIAKQNAKNAGFDNLNLKRADFMDLDFSKFKNCTFICNPPYGERMDEVGNVREMYKAFGKKFAQTENCSLYIITSHQDFPSLFGRKEDKNRKLFNGNIKCYLFSYLSKKI